MGKFLKSGCRLNSERSLQYKCKCAASASVLYSQRFIQVWESQFVMFITTFWYYIYPYIHTHMSEYMYIYIVYINVYVCVEWNEVWALLLIILQIHKLRPKGPAVQTGKPPFGYEILPSHLSISIVPQGHTNSVWGWGWYKPYRLFPPLSCLFSF